MADLLAAAANALDIAGKITAVVRWVLRKLARMPPEPALSDRRWDFEVRPIGFTIDLTRQLPFVEVRFYIINYQTRTLTLAELKVTFLRLSGGPTLERVPLVQEDFPVSPKATQLVTCRRNLLDAEARVLRHRKGPQTASFALVAKARYKRHEYKYDPVGSVEIEGWVNSASMAN